MGKKYTKAEAVAIAISGARLYRDNFAGKRLLFVMTDKHKRVFGLEVGFDASNYHHLTGLVATNPQWSHLDFYNFCLDGRLSARDIAFAPGGTTHQKLSVLLAAFRSSNLSASMMGNFNHSHPFLYTEKLVGGVKWALGFRDVSGRGDYLPDTLLEGDIRDQVTDCYRILATYCKEPGEERFATLVYRAKKVDVERLDYPEDWGERPRLTANVKRMTSA